MFGKLKEAIEKKKENKQKYIKSAKKLIKRQL